MGLKVKAILNETPQPKTLADVPVGEVWLCSNPKMHGVLYYKYSPQKAFALGRNGMCDIAFAMQDIIPTRKIADSLEFVFDDTPEMSAERQTAAKELAEHISQKTYEGEITIFDMHKAKCLANKVLGEKK